MRKSHVKLGVAAIVGWLGGCTTVSEGIANNAAGKEFRAEFCNSVVTFVRSPLASDGLRGAWFLPFGVSEEWIDFYAPMAGKPYDEVAEAFYEQRVGQLTHYAERPEFASAIAKCLVSDDGFSRRSYSLTEDHMRGSFWDGKLDRRIEIYADNDVAGIFVFEGDMQGDLESYLRYDAADACED